MLLPTSNARKSFAYNWFGRNNDGNTSGSLFPHLILLVYKSASWEDTTEEKIQSCFFPWFVTGGTRWVFSQIFILWNCLSFHRGSLWRIFMHGFEKAGCQNDAEICEEGLQSRQEDDEDNTGRSSAEADAELSTKAKGCLQYLMQFVDDFSFKIWTCTRFLKQKNACLTAYAKTLMKQQLNVFWKWITYIFGI